MVNELVFGGVPLSSFGVFVSGEATYASPARSYDKITVPGRNGVLLIDNGYYENIEVEYPCFVRDKFTQRAEAVRNAFLHAGTGYQRLEDSWHADEFRLGVFSDTFEPETGSWNESAHFSLTFDCKPQRFLKSGENQVIIDSSVQLANPSNETALPLIRVYGSSGRVTVGNVVMVFNSIDSWIDVDCDMQDCFKGDLNKNSTVNIPRFPTLPAGTTGVSFSGDITQVRITPRWWRL